eukprot:jgi/Mesvir1/26906/Mv20633-RA.1
MAKTKTCGCKTASGGLCKNKVADPKRKRCRVHGTASKRKHRARQGEAEKEAESQHPNPNFFDLDGLDERTLKMIVARLDPNSMKNLAMTTPKMTELVPRMATEYYRENIGRLRDDTDNAEFDVLEADDDYKRSLEGLASNPGDPIMIAQRDKALSDRKRYARELEMVESLEDNTHEKDSIGWRAIIDREDLERDRKRGRYHG